MRRTQRRGRDAVRFQTGGSVAAHRADGRAAHLRRPARMPLHRALIGDMSYPADGPPLPPKEKERLCGVDVGALGGGCCVM